MSRDGVIGNVGVVRQYLPNIYAMGTVTEGKLTYGGGLEWALDNWWGWGSGWGCEMGMHEPYP